MNEYLKIINHYGVNNQLKKLNEEIYELTEAILENHANTHIVEEFADVLVLLEQIRQKYNIDIENVTNCMKYKVKRQLQRVENECEVSK